MIRVHEMSVEAGSFRLEKISLEIPTGAYGVLMGKTGCGKTSVLEAICGLKTVRAGTIELDGRDVTDLRPGERGLGFVPQDVALFNTMTVYEHLAFGPSVHGWRKPEIRDSVEQIAERLNIGPLLQRKPYGLSGGERQRVALGRALTLRPKTLLLDEPLSALDEETSEQICSLLKSIQEDGVTTLHVTHNRRETERLADCRFRMEDGAVRVVS